MTDDALELTLLEAYVARFEAAPNDADKCSREIDLRGLLASLTQRTGDGLDNLTELWIRRLAPGRPGHDPGPLRHCSNGTKNASEHRYHLRAFRTDLDSPAWDRIRELRRDGLALSSELVQSVAMSTPTIRVFVSHGADDVVLATRLIELLRAALNLPASAIRCTSVDGYRLPGGANTDEQLRLEVHETEAFIGMVSAGSLRSLYVLFELGARWGAKKPLIPLLTPGSDVGILGGPLAGLNALRADSASQMHQLIRELANTLRVQPESPAVYQSQLEQVVKAVPAADLRVSTDSQLTERSRLTFEERDAVSDLSDEARRLLIEASTDRHGDVLLTKSLSGVQIQTNSHGLVEQGNARSEARWKRALGDLTSARLLETDNGEVFHVTDDGYRVADLLQRS